MKYSSATSFAAALSAFMRREAEQRGQSIQRIRHEVAFDRVLARLLAVDSKAWLLKGGVALEYRLPPAVSRTTVDVDLTIDVTIMEEAHIAPFVSAAAEIDLGDFFTMTVTATPHGNLLDELNVHRYKVRLDLMGKMFDAVALDISVTDHVFGVAEILNSRPHLAFAGIDPLQIPAIPVEQHLTEGGRPSREFNRSYVVPTSRFFARISH
ncbi:MAG TPA: nucleotidyl transferase AbiEii/AbiGii toxin family protein [Candidatus Baltobacteraceae bacterium]|nr:nucleotidyl transferase AbiEii/AbiGii toxin family protein [Candidatus Baltobacteraceae bacterium]